MKSFILGLVATTFIIFSGCSIYRSADRVAFESDTPQIKIKSLQRLSCSNSTVQNAAQSKTLIYTTETEKLYQYLLPSETIYESTLEPTLESPVKAENYCLYAVELE